MAAQGQSVAETQMSLEEIKEKMPEVYAQIREREANPHPTTMLAKIKYDYLRCLKAVDDCAIDLQTLRDRERQLKQLISDIEKSKDVIDFMNRFDALPVLR